MAFCKYSFDMIANNTTAVDNIFINNYLPYADSTAVKVYLYGLYKCQDSNSKDNTLDHFSQELHLKEEEVERAFLYWQEQGLVQILNVIPFEVRYLPISDVLNNTKKYNAKKYQNFNTQAQELLCGRMITPNEYREYYDLVERLHIEKDALLEIINYCVRTKGDNISYNYITAVAKNWISQGLISIEQVRAKILEIDTLNSDMETFVKAIGIKRAFTMEEYELYKKWAVEYGFETDIISYVAKKNKAKSNFIFQTIDKILEKYYSQKLFSLEEIEAFELQKTNAYNLAKTITKNLGLYYEHLDPVLENYVLPWTNMGFSEEMLLTLSNHCFKTNVRTLEGMNKLLTKFQKMGILTEQSLGQYMNEVLSVDKQIKAILENIGLSRNVNQFDRDKFKVWTESWHLPNEIIDYACTLAIGKDQPMQYLSGILSSFHDKNIRTLDDAKNSFDIVSTKSPNKSNFSTGRSYSKEEMSTVFQTIEEIDI